MNTASRDGVRLLTVAENSVVADVLDAAVMPVLPDLRVHEYDFVPLPPVAVAVIAAVVAPPGTVTILFALPGALTDSGIVADAPHNWPSEIGSAVGTPLFVGVFGT